MFCKVCGTEMEAGGLTCPNCGYIARKRERDERHVKEKPARTPRTFAPSRAAVHLEPTEATEFAEAGAGVDEEEDEMAIHKEADTSTPVFTLDAAGLRRLLARQPELLEEGLSILTDEKGKRVGVGYSTEIGDIDLLARDGSGAFVVVMVAEPGQGERLVAEILQRIGWVRKHLGKGRYKVRGIILMEELPENLSYAAAAVADTVAFKAYRVALTFKDLEL